MDFHNGAINVFLNELDTKKLQENPITNYLEFNRETSTIDKG